MTTDSNSEFEPLTREASRLVMQLVSGEATAADAEAVMLWRRQSPAHQAAFAEAARVWSILEAGGRAFIEQKGVPAWSGRPRQMARRAFLGGGAALAAATAAYAIVHPPADLWPSLDALRADYRTATGEQRRVTLADIAIQMNTQTSIAVPAQGDGIDRVRLITGEASFAVPAQARRSLIVLAGLGRTVTNQARFDVRQVGLAVCVTCADGQVQVEQGGRAVHLAAGSQLTYDDRGLGQNLAIDTAEATAWQDGFIVFRSTPLAEVVIEVNRYRRGRVILINAALGRTTVSGRFRIERIDEVLAWVEQAAGARARVLPGGIVLLS